MVSLLDSPEYLTYIGAFDFLNPIIKHNRIFDAEKSYIDCSQTLNSL